MSQGSSGEPEGHDPCRAQLVALQHEGLDRRIVREHVTEADASVLRELWKGAASALNLNHKASALCPEPQPPHPDLENSEGSGKVPHHPWARPIS